MKNIKNNLNPLWISGFVDGEGCFTIKISKNEQYRVGWFIQPCFLIQLHFRDKYLLLQIKSFFENTGTVWINSSNVYYQVRNINEIIKVIIPHFDKYPLISKKQSDFLLFKNIVKLMEKGKHLEKDSLKEIISLKASLNKGLSNKLNIYFPDIVKVDRPKIYLPVNINYHWFSGFFSG